MTIFSNYAKYYNLLYKDKDYTGEVEYVHNLIQEYRPGATSILDLGCGTGRHDFLLAGKGYSVTGVDMSEEMLAVANSQRSVSLDTSQLSTLIFHHGDIRTIRLNRTFDVIISLFHVMSYQTTNEDLAAAFATAKAHLRPGGIFIFDCWYGPAVLTDRPVVRIKRLENEDIAVTRIAEPVMHANENTVDVNYHMFVKDKTEGRIEEFTETHHMRYLFMLEINQMLRAAELTQVSCEEWMTAKEPGFDTWGVTVVAD